MLSSQKLGFIGYYGVSILRIVLLVSLLTRNSGTSADNWPIWIRVD